MLLIQLNARPKQEGRPTLRGGSGTSVQSEDNSTGNFQVSYLNTTGEGPQNLCSVFLMLSLSVDSSRYHVLWSEAEGPAVGSVWKHKHISSINGALTTLQCVLLQIPTTPHLHRDPQHLKNTMLLLALDNPTLEVIMKLLVCFI